MLVMRACRGGVLSLEMHPSPAVRDWVLLLTFLEGLRVREGRSGGAVKR